MNRQRFTYAIVPHVGGYIIESPNGGGTVLARRPRGPSILDPVPPRMFKSPQAAADYMHRKGMARADRPECRP